MGRERLMAMHKHIRKCAIRLSGVRDCSHPRSQQYTSLLLYLCVLALNLWKNTTYFPVLGAFGVYVQTHIYPPLCIPSCQTLQIRYQQFQYSIRWKVCSHQCILANSAATNRLIFEPKVASLPGITMGAGRWAHVQPSASSHTHRIPPPCAARVQMQRQLTRLCGGCGRFLDVDEDFIHSHRTREELGGGRRTLVAPLLCPNPHPELILDARPSVPNAQWRSFDSAGIGSILKFVAEPLWSSLWLYPLYLSHRKR